MSDTPPRFIINLSGYVAFALIVWGIWMALGDAAGAIALGIWILIWGLGNYLKLEEAGDA